MQEANSWSLPRSSGHRSSLRREGCSSSLLDAWQDQRNLSRQPNHIRRSPLSLSSNALPLVDGRAEEPAQMSRSLSHFYRRTDHGSATQGAPNRGSAVPSRIDPDRPGEKALGELP